MNIIITGTTQGLGHHLSEVLRAHHPLVINRRPSGNDNELIANLSNKRAVDAAARQLVGRLNDKADILFLLNAAEYDEDETMAEITPEMTGRIMYLNIFGQLTLVEALLEAGHNIKLIAVSSKMGSVQDPRLPYSFIYSASKAGLNQAVRLLHIKYGQKLQYLLVHPGWMQTRMGGQGATDDPKETAQRLLTFIEQDTGWNKADGMLNTVDDSTYPF